MKLTVKDKDFLERLKRLLEEKELKIDLKEDGVKRFVLRQNYGDVGDGENGVKYNRDGSLLIPT